MFLPPVDFVKSQDALRKTYTPEYIRKALDLVCAGHITSAFFVNREEPLANLLEVMRHLMSHNGHLKTAILP